MHADDPHKLRGNWTEFHKKNLYDVARSSQMNLFTSQVRYYNPFSNAKATNKGESTDFAHFYPIGKRGSNQ